MLQLARELRVVAVDVQQHEVAVVRSRALRHALRGGGAIGALQVQLLCEGRTACGATGAGGGSAQRNHRLEAAARFAQRRSTLLPERQEGRRAPSVAAVRVPAGAILLWLVAAHCIDFGRAAVQVRAGSLTVAVAPLRAPVASTASAHRCSDAGDVRLENVHGVGMRLCSSFGM